jgi:hypothetical protein
MLQQTVPQSEAGNSISSANRRIRTAANKDIDRMIRADIRRIERKMAGTGRRIHDEYGLCEREINSVSVDVRSGFKADAYTTLLEAYETMHPETKPQQMIH